MSDAILAILSSLALIEWRRAGAADRIADLEGRVLALEASSDLAERVSALEAANERLRRNL